MDLFIKFIQYVFTLDSAPLLVLVFLLFIYYYKKVIYPKLQYIMNKIEYIHDNFLTKEDVDELVIFVNNLSERLDIVEKIHIILEDIKNDIKECLEMLKKANLALADSVKQMIEQEMPKMLNMINRLESYEKDLESILTSQTSLDAKLDKNNAILIDLSNEILKINEDVKDILISLDTLIRLLQNRDILNNNDKDNYIASVLLRELIESRNKIDKKYNYLKYKVEELFPTSRLQKYRNKSGEDNS